jgi:cyanophycinase-like exopeptidase
MWWQVIQRTEVFGLASTEREDSTAAHLADSVKSCPATVFFLGGQQSRVSPTVSLCHSCRTVRDHHDLGVSSSWMTVIIFFGAEESRSAWGYKIRPAGGR